MYHSKYNGLSTELVPHLRESVKTRMAHAMKDMSGYLTSNLEYM